MFGEWIDQSLTPVRTRQSYAEHSARRFGPLGAGLKGLDLIRKVVRRDGDFVNHSLVEVGLHDLDVNHDLRDILSREFGV